MKLNQFLEKHPSIRLATEKENTDILSFFENAPMKGEEIELAYHRAPDFFSFLKFHSDQYFVFYIPNEATQAIEAVGTLVIRPGLVDGQKVSVGYFGDLRVTQIRKWGREWRNFYDALIHEAPHIEEMGGVEFFLTAMLDDNPMAHQALTADKQKKDKLKVEYYPVQKYSMVNVIAPIIPITFQAHSFYDVEKWDTGNLDSAQWKLLENFLVKQNQSREFGFVFEGMEEFRRRLRLWQPILFVVSDAAAKTKTLVGLTLLWAPSPHKKIILKRLSPFLKVLRNLPFFGRTLPKEGGELKVGYLSTLELEKTLSRELRGEILRTLLQFIFSNGYAKNFHSVAFADFSSDDYQSYLKGWWTMSKGLQLFQVVEAGGKKVRLDEPPGFEMSLV